MKKNILLILSVLSITTTTYCQTSFGIKGGINYANLGGAAAGVKSKITFHAGLFGIIKPSDRFGIQPEIVFSRQGAAMALDPDVKINYDYVNIPLMLNYYPTEIFYVQAGPQLGLVVSGKITNGKDSEDVTDQLNSTDLALGIGFGFDLRFATIGLRYNGGLSSTTDGGNDGEKFINEVLQLSIGLKFN